MKFSILSVVISGLFQLSAYHTFAHGLQLAKATSRTPSVEALQRGLKGDVPTGTKLPGWRDGVEIMDDQTRFSNKVDRELPIVKMRADTAQSRLAQSPASAQSPEAFEATRKALNRKEMLERLRAITNIEGDTREEALRLRRNAYQHLLISGELGRLGKELNGSILRNGRQEHFPIALLKRPYFLESGHLVYGKSKRKITPDEVKRIPGENLINTGIANDPDIPTTGTLTFSITSTVDEPIKRIDGGVLDPDYVYLSIKPEKDPHIVLPPVVRTRTQATY